MTPLGATVDPFDLIGSTLAEKYRVDGVIGEGGFGVVYAGTHALLDVPIAIKCMRPTGLTPRSAALESELFMREAKVLFALSHPGIVRLYDIGIFKTTNYHFPYVVLEMLHGKTLEERIDQRNTCRQHFSATELLAMLEPVLDALAYAHGKGVVHRDLKPSNIMLTTADDSSFATKVVDFGIARWTNAKHRHTSRGAPMFSPLYAAPEQWDPRLGPTDAMSDIFALGLVLAEMCTLQPVFDATMGPVQLIQHSMTVGGRQIVQATRPDLGPAFAAVVDRATRGPRAQRMATAKEFLHELRAAVADAPQAAPPVPGRVSGRVPCPASKVTTHARADTPSSAPPAVASRVCSQATTAAAPYARTEAALDACAEAATAAGTGGSTAAPSTREDAARVTALQAGVAPHAQIIFWKDVFVVIDDGQSAPSDYRHFEELILAQKRKYLHGIGCLVVIPQRATPPSDEVRAAINRTLDKLQSGLRCCCWVVEGTGFQAAIARAVLTGFRLFSRRSYPTNVCTNVSEALAWMLSHLEGGDERLAEAREAAASISGERVDGFAR
jgi:serine/threonine protein kinase